jgi:hypothetical protein
MKIIAVESMFDHPNFDFVLLTMHFALLPIKRVYKLVENGVLR